jgi:signal peptidase II
VTTDSLSRWRNRLLHPTLAVLGILALDQLTKVLVARNLALGESLKVVPGLVNFTMVRNTGMAFGLLSGSDVPYKSFVVTLMSLLAMAAVAYFALRAETKAWMARVGLWCILGGAFGNIIDRVRLGYVVDFVDVFYGNAHWPAFNLADACISVGVGLLLLDSFRQDHSTRATSTEVAAEASTGDR